MIVKLHVSMPGIKAEFFKIHISVGSAVHPFFKITNHNRPPAIEIAVTSFDLKLLYSSMPDWLIIK